MPQNTTRAPVIPLSRASSTGRIGSTRLQERVDDLGNRRLIDDLGNGEYQISDKGINWEENKKPPL
jgi:predicted transcriptional regulator